MFENMAMASADPILGLAAIFQADPRPGKVDLGIGVYRDPTGVTPIPAAVRAAEAGLHADQRTKAYVGLAGDRAFNAAIADLVLGSAVEPARVRSVQAAGGSAAFRILCDLIARANPDAIVHMPDPSWPNHGALIAASGLRAKTYPYYDPESGSVDFAAATAAIATAAPGDVLLLHGCCHNPTGADLDGDQWRALAELCKDRRLLPLVDIAYQGFGDGIDEDAAGLRGMAAIVPEMMVATSCSKNFGVYRDRVGAAILVASDDAQADTAMSQLLNVVRSGHTMPPDHGAAVVARILGDADLTAIWTAELEGMRNRLKSLRGALSDALMVRSNDQRYANVAYQRGMFSRLHLTPTQIERLRDDHAIYLVGDGRINVAGLPEREIDRIADAVVAASRLV